MSKVTKILLISAGCLALAFAFCLPRRLFQSPLSAVVTSSDGTLMGARIAADGQWRFEAAASVPPKFEACIVRFEDKRFRRHAGVDVLSVCRALKQNISSGRVVSGASTITMQVIRLSRPDAPRSIAEKFLEAVLALRLELRCSKDRILLLYASNAPFGGNVVGLEAAAWRYFGRPAEELSWAESAMLAVLPNSPAMIHPGKGRDALLAKRNRLLDALAEDGTIDATECELAKDEPLPDAPVAMPDEAHHLLERARREKGDRTFRTTLDRSLQRRVCEIAKSHFPANHSNLVDNMGIIVVSVRTGDILAYYGNTRGLEPGLRGADVDMIPAARSSGSTLKPLLYAAMLEDGSILPGTLIKDTPYTHDDFSPQNFSRTFEGAVPAHEVIERSLNVPSVRMLEQYGTDRFLGLLRRIGFSTITRDADHYGLSLILGGAEISLYTLARAYYRMAAKLAGDPISKDLRWAADSQPREMSPRDVPLGKAAIWLTFDALSNANRPEEEASWMDFQSSGSIAWKTGTSWGNRDAWSVGVDREYVVAVWVGNSDGEGRAQMTGVAYASPVMFDVFAALDKGGWFEQPVEEMSLVEVCHESGNPAGRLCPQRDTVWAPDVRTRPAACKYHRIVHLDAEGRYQVNSSCCPTDAMREEVRFVLPPAQEWYYSRKHLDYRPLPPKHPLYDSASDGFGPVGIIYPQEGITVVVTRGLDGSRKGAVFKAAHADPDAELFWHLDSDYLGETAGMHEMMVLPEPGKHVLTVTDTQGACAIVRFRSE